MFILPHHFHSVRHIRFFPKVPQALPRRSWYSGRGKPMLGSSRFYLPRRWAVDPLRPVLTIQYKAGIFSNRQKALSDFDSENTRMRRKIRPLSPLDIGQSRLVYLGHSMLGKRKQVAQ